MLLCYITDRTQFPGSEAERHRRLLAKIAEAARAGVDFIQLREKDLSARLLEQLAAEALAAVRNASSRTRLLINSRMDIALAIGADGVHLRSDDIYPSEARVVWTNVAESHRSSASLPSRPFISVSCHSAAEVRIAAAHGADLALFAPVFEKNGVPGAGLDALRDACQSQFPARNVEGPGTSSMAILALGGVTTANARACFEAGADGIAAIRLFQENQIAHVAPLLRTFPETHRIEL